MWCECWCCWSGGRANGETRSGGAPTPSRALDECRGKKGDRSSARQRGGGCEATTQHACTAPKRSAPRAVASRGGTRRNRACPAASMLAPLDPSVLPWALLSMCASPEIADDACGRWRKRAGAGLGGPKAPLVTASGSAAALAPIQSQGRRRPPCAAAAPPGRSATPAQPRCLGGCAEEGEGAWMAGGLASLAAGAWAGNCCCEARESRRAGEAPGRATGSTHSTQR